MNNETQKRIKAYKAALPALRERVIAVALLLAMSASMLASASYAWITLSTAPEVSGMATTVAANGNLEIALVNPEGDLPAESAVGDSSAAEGRNMADANITWGNLVNLSDPVYGLDQIALRPALLSEYNINKYPLYGANYGKDGRVESVSDRYVYASYKIASDGTDYFDAMNYDYGVRAITSVKYANITGNATSIEMEKKIADAYQRAQESYFDLVEGRTTVDDNGLVSGISALEGMLEVFAQEKADNMVSNTAVVADYSDYVTYFYRLMEVFMGILDLEGQGLVHLANLQAFLQDASVGTEAFKSLDELLNASAADLETYGVQLGSLASYKTNRTTLQNDLNGNMKTLAEQCDPSKTTNPPKVTWTQIQPVVNNFVHINSTTLDGMEIGGLGGDDLGTLFNIITSNNASNPSSVIIKSGILRDTEKRLGARMADRSVIVQIYIEVTMGLTIRKNVYARVTTTADTPSLSATDREATSAMNDSFAGADAVSKDTYGMAVDLWIRTNAPNMVVTLEGTTLYTYIPATVADKNGNETNLYELDLDDGSTAEVYKITENGTDVWYYTDHTEVDTALLEEKQPKEKTIPVVSGYEGENRIWEEWETMLEAGLIEEDSTTQGSGSCFIFYADPSEQVRILEMLDAFRVAFVNAEGTEVGTAALNTENAYAINGKVTVPLEVISGTEYMTEDNEEALGIMPLKQNEPTWITAIMYLNGMRLENKNVLSAGEIQGRLNIQFGSSVSLTNPDDEKLQMEYRAITASAVAGDQTSPSDDNIKFNYTGSAHAVEVTLAVDGEQPERISGFFQRIINATQGTSGEEVTFTKQEDGTWKATFGLTAPGTYALRNLMVDGVPYELDSCPTVMIEGLSVGAVTTSLKSGIHMTADSSLPVTVTAQIVTDTVMPGQVRAQFRSNDGKEFNALMSYDSTQGRWVGTANITSSGTYTLKYLVMDGEYSELPAQYQTTLLVYLGMKTQIWGTQPVHDDAEEGDAYIFRGPVSIPVTAKVWDDTGAEIKSLQDVHLWYRAEGSYVDQGGMDGEMTWDAANGCYAGTLVMTSPGIYRFNRLQNSAGSITNGTAPVFSAISENLPAFYKADTDDYQIAIGSNGVMKVQLGYASSATVYADVLDENGNNVLVRGSVGTEYDATIGGEQTTVNDFTFPVGAGSWTLKKLYLQNVYDKDTGTMYYVTAEDQVRDNSYTMDVPDGISAYVVTSMVTSLKDSSQKDFNGIEYTGVFMQEHTLSGLNLTIQDSKGKPIYHVNEDGTAEGITGVTWSFKYQDSTDTTYGGYDGASQTQADVVLTTSDHKVFTAPDQKFRLAGEYATTSMTVTFADGTTKAVEVRPLIKVRSQTPSVAITAISPTGTYDVDKDGEGEEHDSATVPAWSATNATVYFKCSRSGSGSTCDPYRHNYSRPSVTITISNMGNAASANLDFGTDVHIYNGTTKTTGYSWTTNGACARNIGYYRSRTAANDNKTPADTLTANSLVLTYNNTPYTVTIPTITISNPY